MPVSAGEAEITLKFRYGTSPRFAYCVFGVDNPDAHTAEYIIENAVQDWSESISAFQSAGVALIEGKAVTGEGTYFIDNETIVGGAPANTLAPNTAFLLRKLTGLTGRENQGRMYVPGPWEAAVSDTGLVDATIRDDMTTAANSFLAKLTADGIPMVILHKAVPTPEGVEVLELNCDAFVATQRRRLRG